MRFRAAVSWGRFEQQQYLQGYLGIEFMKLYLDHGFIPRSRSSGPTWSIRQT